MRLKENYELLYTPLHERKKWFKGYSILHYAHYVKHLIDGTGSRTLLDYGSGKGEQYTVKKLHEDWGVDMPVCYDVGVKGLRARPSGKFDGVICCDVMEHIHVADVDEILTDIFSYATKFVFLAIGLLPSREGKNLLDGRGVHLTIRSRQWWRDRVSTAAGGKIYKIAYDKRIRARFSSGYEGNIISEKEE